MVFKEGAKLFATEVVREAESDVLYVNYIGADFVPSIADSALVMSRTIDSLIENPNVSKIVLVQQKNYVYDLVQTEMLKEIAQIFVYLTKQEKILSFTKLAGFNCQQCLSRRFSTMKYLVLELLKQDPVKCFFEAKRAQREASLFLEKMPSKCKVCQTSFIRTLNKVITLLSNTTLIKNVGELERYVDRSVYYNIFRSDIVPNFTFTRLITSLPSNAEIIEQYKIGEGHDQSQVLILKVPNKAKFFYHLTPPEYILDEEHYKLLDKAKNVLVEHQPKAEEFLDTERIRTVFFSVARDLIQELAESEGVKLSFRQLNKLADILVRHTIGFGVIEVLLQDEKLQDIVLNSPISKVPIYVRHQDFDECYTNLIPNQDDANSWAAKFRMISGRPLDEANPILDTDLILKNSRARVAIIQQPLSPYGLAYALRRHRDKPWTLPLFIKNNTINDISAGLLSFLIDGSRTMLVAGTRSAGKTSLLGSLMLEIMPKYRIIVTEDTLELPVDVMRQLNYDILRMKVRAALLEASTEVSAEEGIRASLRLGDSSLIVGEIRSKEAKALYEAMRIGALANVVAGTIHGASAYAVFDRVVNDLEVPITSFKATDLVIVVNPVKSPDGMRSYKRVMSITEVRKHWTKDPLEERGFVDLMRYNVEKDELEITPDFTNGDSEIIKDIAANVQGWAGNWDAIWDNIMLRANIKREIVETAKKLNLPQLLEAEFNVISNNAFHEISEKVRKEIGLPLRAKVFPEWKEWMRDYIRRYIV